MAELIELQVDIFAFSIQQIVRYIVQFGLILYQAKVFSPQRILGTKKKQSQQQSAGFIMRIF